MFRFVSGFRKTPFRSYVSLKVQAHESEVKDLRCPSDLNSYLFGQKRTFILSPP